MPCPLYTLYTNSHAAPPYFKSASVSIISFRWPFAWALRTEKWRWEPDSENAMEAKATRSAIHSFIIRSLFIHHHSFIRFHYFLYLFYYFLLFHRLYWSPNFSKPFSKPANKNCIGDFFSESILLSGKEWKILLRVKSGKYVSKLKPNPFNSAIVFIDFNR